MIMSHDYPLLSPLPPSLIIFDHLISTATLVPPPLPPTSKLINDYKIKEGILKRPTAWWWWKMKSNKILLYAHVSLTHTLYNISHPLPPFPFMLCLLKIYFLLRYLFICFIQHKICVANIQFWISNKAFVGGWGGGWDVCKFGSFSGHPK